MAYLLVDSSKISKSGPTACEMHCKVCSVRAEISNKGPPPCSTLLHHIAIDYTQLSLCNVEPLQFILHTMVMFLQCEFYVMQTHKTPSPLSMVRRTLCGLALFTFPDLFWRSFPSITQLAVHAPSSFRRLRYGMTLPARTMLSTTWLLSLPLSVSAQRTPHRDISNTPYQTLSPCYTQCSILVPSTYHNLKIFSCMLLD